VFEPTVPNLLTIFRILLVPVLVVVLLSEVFESDWPAAAVFALASLTDVADGYLARRNDQVSTFGKLWDPLADKLLVTAALISLVSLERLDAWVAMVIIAREFAVTGLRQLAIEQGHVMAAGLAGKLKTLLQVAMVLVLIIVDGRPLLVDLLIYLTVAVTVASGIEYFVRMAPVRSRERTVTRDIS
jgi:CDP-diacylglycerol--glycerol-3-phosphate 3-phosphatidyltransferase